MKKSILLVIALSTLLFSNTYKASKDFHEQFCKANPYHSKCVSIAFDGRDTPEKQLRIEYNDNYYELDDYRTRPGQDMEDMRESL